MHIDCKSFDLLFVNIILSCDSFKGNLVVIYKRQVCLASFTDIYGSAETQVGQFLRLNPELRKRVQVLTKITISEEDIGRLSRDMIEYVSETP